MTETIRTQCKHDSNKKEHNVNMTETIRTQCKHGRNNKNTM